MHGYSALLEDAPNISRLWAGLLIEELVRSGIDFFCLAPGSRSTPLLAAVADHPLARKVVHFDERATAFAALGYARASGKPAVWITTSGTAVANGMPAVVEASTEGVPMLLLTADRPPELRDTAANQAVDQARLFGSYVRWQFDVPPPSEAISPAFVLTTVDQALHRATRSPAGPIHLNLMFREPLAPEMVEWNRTEYLEPVRRWLGSTGPYTDYLAADAHVSENDLNTLASLLSARRRGLIVVGKTDLPVDGDAVYPLAAKLGWPVLPDLGSGMRLGEGETEHRIAHYDGVLSSSRFAAAYRPEAVLHLGGRLTSKRLLTFLADAKPPVYVGVREVPFRLDPAHIVSHAVEANPGHFAAGLARALPPREADGAWRSAWRQADRAAAAVLGSVLAPGEELTEPAAARIVSEEIAEGHGLFVASSMPIRDLDLFASSHGARVRVTSNRGASGIDGTVASAVGFAAGLRAPVTLLLGDLALLYDLNALALLRASPHPVTVVALNNDGGGIFSFLPIAQFSAIFEPYFGTPHGLSFEHAAAMFGIPYNRPRSQEEFKAAYLGALQRGTSSLIEVPSNRAENLAKHRLLQQSLARSIERDMGTF